MTDSARTAGLRRSRPGLRSLPMSSTEAIASVSVYSVSAMSSHPEDDLPRHRAPTGEHRRPRRCAVPAVAARRGSEQQALPCLDGVHDLARVLVQDSEVDY